MRLSDSEEASAGSKLTKRSDMKEQNDREDGPPDEGGVSDLESAPRLCAPNVSAEEIARRL